MLKNYFKIAIAVLLRKKFFTFISLFGISFTLTILIVITAFMEHFLGPNYPEANRERCLYIESIAQKSMDETWNKNTAPSFYFLNNYVRKLQIPTKVSIASRYLSTTSLINNKKINIDVKHTNAAFWEVMNFEFLEGRPYIKSQVENGEKVAVITQFTKNQYFGKVKSAIGKLIESDHLQFKVIGVVRDVPVIMQHSYADMYLPYTVSGAYKADTTILGHLSHYEGILLADSKSDLSNIMVEYQQLLKTVPLEDPKNYPKVFSNADSYLVCNTRDFFGNDKENGLRKYYIFMVTVLLIFILLPIVNLVNINTSRILERSSEIGLRKAFGASSNTLVLQFLVENILLTLLGGAFSIFFSFVILAIFNSSSLLPHTKFAIDTTILFYSLATFLLFGVLSGVYPAWRMSRMNIVSALKI